MVDREACVGVLSQSADRAPCSVCHREIPVTRLGMIRTHGPVTNRCPGLSNPPLQAPGSSDPIANSAIKPNPPNVKILKRIPRAARDLAARRLASIIDDVVRENSTSCWDRLFRFSVRCLRAPKRAGHRRSLATLATQMIREEGDPDQHTSSKRLRRPSQQSWESLAARISSKLEEGDFKGAVRLASSEDTIRDLDEETLSALRDKHPAAHPDTDIPPASITSQLTPLHVSAEEVDKAIRSFPCASAAGPDGLRPQHLKDMTGVAAGEGGRLLLQALTSFMNLVLQGKVAQPARHFFFGATLIALGKKDGGVRPIAVGCTLRRLASKCACNSVKQAMAALLAPHQLGFSIPLGAEAAVHATRVYLQDMPDHHLLLKLDFRNAFNSLRRDKMLLAVCEKATRLRLGVPICQPHKCQLCGSPVDRQGTHGLHCRKSLDRHPRHSAINDLIKRSLGSAKIPAHLEPAGICRSDGKRPDGATVLPWRSGRILVWDATCPDTFAPSPRDLTTRGAGAVADQAEERKKAKYAELATTTTSYL